jgi:hypothetical protein
MSDKDILSYGSWNSNCKVKEQGMQPLNQIQQYPV